MYWCPDVCIYTQKSTRIWKVYLNDSKMYMNSLDSYILASRDNGVSCNQTLGCLRLYGESRVSRAQPRINAYEILLQHDWLLFFYRHNRFAETHSHLQLWYLTDRLLAAGNEHARKHIFIKICMEMVRHSVTWIKRSGKLYYM